MTYEGYLDGCDGSVVWGWVFDSRFPDATVNIDIFADGGYLLTLAADAFRQDLLASNKGNGRHAFNFIIPAECKNKRMTVRIHNTGYELQSSGAGTIALREHYWFRHSLEWGFPKVASRFSKAARSDSDTEIAERLIEAFHAALKDAPPAQHDGMWSHIQNSFHGEMECFLYERDAAGLSNYLLDVYEKPVTHGVIQGHQTYRELVTNEQFRQFVAGEHSDQLASLAEALGCRNVECVEQTGNWCENWFANVDALQAEISAVLGVDLVPPEVANGLFGLATRKGVLHFRDIEGAYAAWRAKNILKGRTEAAVCEIGASNT